MLLKHFFFLFSVINYLNAFIPARIIDFLIEKADGSLKDQFGEVSHSYTHEEIIRQGVIRSTVKYFSEQKDLAYLKLNLSQIEKYFNLRALYKLIYNRTFCKTDLDEIIFKDLQPSVASVDFDSDTKDMPYAHFDANTFRESNLRVMNMTKKVLESIRSRKFERAREISGKVLHTIQDFYSHSNWIEMGNHDKINKAIGTVAFDKFKFASKSDNITCVANCTIKEIKCNKMISTMISLLKNLRKTNINCPIKYFKCKGNIVTNDRLVTGYYVDQKLPDGTSASKPADSLMCSHGGLLDSDSFRPVQGGINKDTGYYLFSPHAHLHQTAAKLAIKHTEYFFDQIRAEIGDDDFSKFVRIIMQDLIELIQKNLVFY
ncbi:von Willebrand factor A domain-containing 7-like [Brachionus plicatilis]|uniref:von Willebrand factor A domain-containing 7-like n=1 Tax=Brachionus plicatilis TaxID=10195 RepID=A0A3M7S7W8_BRAPC|nr:von Willebrand factor A domain-containing 7-like [Brachionus plicatilis]